MLEPKLLRMMMLVSYCCFIDILQHNMINRTKMYHTSYLIAQDGFSDWLCENIYDILLTGRCPAPATIYTLTF